MIGDWVIRTQTMDRNLRILKEPIKVYTRVESILEDGINQDNCQGCDDYVDIESVDPIPLTDGVLKANGFRKSIEEGTYYFPEGYKAHERGYAIENEDGLWYITEHNLMPFVYVHELQHALRLCGLNDLADNFKIE